MTPIRLGAVGYLNARPLVHGLSEDPRFSLRFDVPSTCARLLHEGAIDLGMIPAIEFFTRPDYAIVPGASIASEGAVASVAVYTDRPTEEIRSIAVDSSSRTSVALLKVLCAERFSIRPTFTTFAPDLKTMLSACDAALIIGDLALFTDHEADGLRKIDLGEEWTSMTGLPFVWAFWAGRPAAASAQVVAALNAARDRGVAASDAIAREYVRDEPEREALAMRYVREYIEYGFGPRHRRGLQRYYDSAAKLGIVSAPAVPQFYSA
jgi:chorismate dehydratase